MRAMLQRWMNEILHRTVVPKTTFYTWAAVLSFTVCYARYLEPFAKITRMKWAYWIIPAAILIATPISVHADDADTSGQSAGWTPKQANEWVVTQMKYAQAVKQFGKNSPEATQAQVEMNTMARDLGIKAPTDVPEEASMEPPPPPVEDDDSAPQRQASVGLPASMGADSAHPQPAPQDDVEVPEVLKTTAPVENAAPLATETTAQ